MQSAAHTLHRPFSWLACILLPAALLFGGSEARVDVASGKSGSFKPVPINMAEAIIELFWIPELSGFAKWRVDPGAEHGLRIRQNWSAVDFEWASKPISGPALRLSRDIHVDCGCAGSDSRAPHV